MRRALTCTTLLFTLAIFACDSKSDDTTVEGARVGESLKERAEEAVAESEPGDCKTYVNELREACLASLEEGLKFDCGMVGMIPARVMLKQAEGELFETDNPNAVVQGVCRANLKQLRSHVAKAKRGEAKAESPACKAVVEALDETCFEPITRMKSPPRSCDTAVMLGTMEIKRGECDPEFANKHLK